MHNNVTGCVIFISNKIEYLKVKQLKKIHQKTYIMILTDLSNKIKKLWKKISFHKRRLYIINRTLHGVLKI